MSLPVARLILPRRADHLKPYLQAWLEYIRELRMAMKITHNGLCFLNKVTLEFFDYQKQYLKHGEFGDATNFLCVKCINFVKRERDFIEFVNQVSPLWAIETSIFYSAMNVLLNNLGCPFTDVDIIVPIGSLKPID